MGFLKFLKKSKKDKLELPIDEDLDMPPPPPITSKEFPTMPKFEEKTMSSPENKLPNFPDLELNEPKMPNELPEPPQLPEVEEKIEMPVVRTKPSVMPEIKKPKLTDPIDIDKKEIQAIKESKAVLEHEPVPLKPIYIKIEKFKEIKKSSGIIKNDIKNNEDILAKLHDIKSEKDKEFDKWSKTLDDIQKRLIYVDKTLFKGD